MTHRFRFYRRWGAVVAAVLISSAIAVTAASSKTRALAPVKFYVDAPLADPIQTFPELVTGAQAAAKAITAAGGINGRPIQLVVCDNKIDVNVSAACAHGAATAGVVADVASQSSFWPVEQAIYRQEHIAIVGMTGSADSYANPIAYPMDGGGLAEYFAVPYALKKLGYKSFAGMGRDGFAAESNVALMRVGARAAGMKYAGAVIYASAATDYSPYALKVKQIGADAVGASASAAAAEGILRGMQAIGYTVRLGISVANVTAATVQTAGSLMNGVVITSSYPSSTQTNLAGIRKFNADLAAAGVSPTDLQSHDTGALRAWLSVYAAAAVAREVKGTLNNVTFLAELQKTKPIKLFDLTTWNPRYKGPAAFSHVGPGQMYFYVAKDGHLVTSPKLPPVKNIFSALHFK